MARKKKTDTSPIESYEHKGAERLNNPPARLAGDPGCQEWTP